MVYCTFHALYNVLILFSYIHCMVVLVYFKFIDTCIFSSYALRRTGY